MITKPISRSENTLWRRVNDDIIVIAQSGQQIFVLNKTAAIIWEMLDGECEIEKISSRLSERFDISYDEARIDVISIIESFILNNIANQN
jgi:hypothetical protein